MKIWLLEEGERVGPYEVFDIRDRISSGELNAETPAWYDGADGWVALAEVPAFESYFKKLEVMENLSEEEKATSELMNSLESELCAVDSKPNSIAFQNEPLHPVRRFFARLLDISLYTIILYIVQIKMGSNPFDTSNPWMPVILYLPYVFFDGWALSYFGYTPGKWLLNIRVRSTGNLYLDTKIALIRSLRVWVLGFAMWSPFMLVSTPIMWFLASRYGKFLWDIPHNTVVHCARLRAPRIFGYFILLFAMSHLFNAMVPRELMPPDLRKMIKKYE